MAIVDSLNEIIAKNGGEVSGRGGTIEKKIKELSELSIGGGGGKVYELTEDGGGYSFYCNPFEVKLGDVLHITTNGEGYSSDEYMQIVFLGRGYAVEEGTRLASFMYTCISGTMTTSFQSAPIHVDEEGQPTEPSDHILVSTGL